MARAFARLAFTPDVHAVQEQMGSRQAYRQTEIGAPEVAELSAFEIDFIGQRDSFYQGTVGQNGWPYVQHRGGPAGFLKVLDERTLGYADFAGNRQYISVGNLSGDNRVSIFLMDYPQQRRLKIWGRARIVDEATEPELVARLESPHYRARVERGIVITVEAFDWNCPKYITPRYSEDEVRTLLDAAHAAGRPLPQSSQSSQSHSQTAAEEVIGAGPLALVVTGMRQLTPHVRAYELRPSDGAPLAPSSAGAHLNIPVRLPDGTVVTRQYSLTQRPDVSDFYEIAVLLEDGGRGASQAIHHGWKIGTALRLDRPINQFPLHDDGRPAVLIAGGIGITPILSMAHVLKARGTPFDLHVSAKRPTEMAYRSLLAREYSPQSHFYFSREAGQRRLDIQQVLRDAPADAVFYVCGPQRLIDAVGETARAMGIAAERVQFESFS